MMRRLVTTMQNLGVLNFVLEALRKLGLLKIAYRTYEKALATNASGAKSRSQAEGLPLPPSDLMVLVAGSPDVDWFLHFGKSMFQILLGTLHKDGVRVESLTAVLEFGCGCGRVLRHWRSIQGPQLYGVDYNVRLIEWCRKSLPFAQFSTNTLYPPLSYRDGMFDCVYAISVFTHMSEALQGLWIKELKRIIRSGGYFLFTTHGESFRDRLTTPEREAFTAGDLVVRYEEASGMNLCSAYHPEVYVRQRMSEGYTVKDMIPAGTQGALHQDLYLLRRD
ncbi:MAG: class I SAM-dependent methyltransferase [candidate division NC10 bacterium]|nr:class I SAM-dependent methyltransferase [candidate division NC10 bacterium]